MAIAKIILNGVVQMDVTQDTVTSGTLVSGETATGADGTTITGSLSLTPRTSADLSASGATVTAPSGYYASDATKTIASGSATTPATTITANPTISVNSSTGVITASVSKTQSVTPTVSEGYVSSGTSGTITVSGSNTSNLTTKGATNYYPSTSDQTIASGNYLTGTQTIRKVVTNNLTASNIKSGVTVTVGDTSNASRIASVTGTYTGGGGGSPTISYYYGVEADYITCNISGIPDIVFFHGYRCEQDNDDFTLSGWATFNPNGSLNTNGYNLAMSYDGNFTQPAVDPISSEPSYGLQGGISNGVLTFYTDEVLLPFTEYLIIAVGATLS